MGLTQQELAEACQLSTNYLATLEGGSKFPSAETLETLALTLKLKPYQLFLGDDDLEAFDRDELLDRYGSLLKRHLGEGVERATAEIRSSGSKKRANPKA